MYGVWFQGVIATQLRLYPVGAVALPILYNYYFATKLMQPNAEVSTELCHYCARDIYARILVK